MQSPVVPGYTERSRYIVHDLREPVAENRFAWPTRCDQLRSLLNFLTWNRGNAVSCPIGVLETYYLILGNSGIVDF